MQTPQKNPSYGPGQVASQNNSSSISQSGISCNSGLTEKEALEAWRVYSVRYVAWVLLRCKESSDLTARPEEYHYEVRTIAQAIASWNGEGSILDHVSTAAPLEAVHITDIMEKAPVFASGPRLLSEMRKGCAKVELERAIASGSYEAIQAAQGVLQSLEVDPEALAGISAKILQEVGNPVLEFDTSVLPWQLKAWVDSITETDHSSPLMLVSLMIPSLSGFFANHYIPEKSEEHPDGYFQRLYANTWTTVITRSGSFKTTALNKAGRFALAYEAELKKKTASLHAELETAQDTEAKTIRGAIKTEELKSVLLPNKVTTEKLLDLLSSNAHGVIRCSELGAWLMAQEKSYNSDLRAMYTDLFDCPPVYSVATQGGGTKTLCNPFVSIAGCSTVDWVKDHIKPSDVASGFFARFLLFTPPIVKRVPDAFPSPGVGAPSAAIDSIRSVLKWAGTKDSFVWTLDEEARAAFTAINASIYKEFHSMPEQRQGILEPYVKRWIPYILKLSIMFEPFFRASDITGDNSAPLKITVRSIKAAAAVVEKAMQSTLWLFQTELGESDSEKRDRLILQYIAKQGGSVLWGKLLASRTLSDGARMYDEVVLGLESAGKVTRSDCAKKANRVVALA